MRTRDGARLVRFAETFGRITKGSRAGQPIKLLPFQRQFLYDLASSGAQTAYMQVARKNGKSTLGAILALYNLCADGEFGAEVYSVAGSREQARIVFQEAAMMVKLSPLRKVLEVKRSEIVHPKSSSVYKALAAEAGLHEGLNPHCVIGDEVHVLGSDRRMWDVMALAMGSREYPLMVGISTPGVRYGRDGRDSFAYELYEYTKKVNSGEVYDPAFFGRVWEAPEGCDTTDRGAWKLANPGMGAFLKESDLEAKQRTTPENEFRTKRLGQWVAAHDAWLPEGAWRQCPRAETLEPDVPIVLGFDGSKSRDATALIAATIEHYPAIYVVKVWERPLMSGAKAWQVPRADVTGTVLQTCERYNVRELAGDAALWVSELQEWRRAGVPVVEFPQSPARMAAAAQRFFENVVTGKTRHDHNGVLARHLGNAQLKINGQIAKDHKDSQRKIDAAVAAVMANERAAALAVPKRRNPLVIR